MVFFSFSLDQVYNRESSLLLAEEIANRQENLCIIVRILEEPSIRPENLKDLHEIGDAVVELWVMIEDSCSIVRQVNLLLICYNVFHFRRLIFVN